MATPLQQLDLFGMPIDAAASNKKKKQPAAKATMPTGKSLIEAPASISEPVVYASEQIVVKIKPKAAVVTKELPKQSGKRGRKSFKEIDAVADLIDIPSDEILQQKLYYSISEVAGWFNVNTSLLRYWENEFDILQPRKTRKGDRLFRIEDIKNLQLIYFLLRQRKFSIEGAKSYLKNNKQKISVETQLVQSLTSFKTFLLQLKSSLNNAH